MENVSKEKPAQDFTSFVEMFRAACKENDPRSVLTQVVEDEVKVYEKIGVLNPPE